MHPLRITHGDSGHERAPVLAFLLSLMQKPLGAFPLWVCLETAGHWWTLVEMTGDCCILGPSFHWHTDFLSPLSISLVTMFSIFTTSYVDSSLGTVVCPKKLS